MLYLTDVIDEPALQNLEKYADKELIDVTREGLNLGDDEEDKQQVQFPLSLSDLPACPSHAILLHNLIA